MSILIKGMEMPSDDKPVTLVITNGRADELVPDVFGARYTTMYRVVEVPAPHGRLIDADRLETKIDERQQNTFEERLFYVYDCIMDAPTIIEAEV